MDKKVLAIFAQHKYKLGVILLLGLASATCIALVLTRKMLSGSFYHLGMVWNLFLAWIPFGLAFVTYFLAWQKNKVRYVLPLFAFLWFIFFPNAPYILTDFQHLILPGSNIPVWFDVILLTWFSWTGFLLGIVSLNLMQETIKRTYGHFLSWLLVLFAAGTSAFGVFLGRFLRLNSWDILYDPQGVFAEIMGQIRDPSLGAIGFIAIYTFFFIFVYLTFYAFGHILQEEKRELVK